MKPRKLKRRLRRAEAALEELLELRVAVTTDDGVILEKTIGELYALPELSGAPVSGVAARSPNVWIGRWRIV